MLNEAWYRNRARTSFHTFNDAGEWLQVDKAGHAWSAYNGSRGLSAMWRWAGYKPSSSAILGSSTTLLFLMGIEYLDAHSSKWGWSWADVGANFAGTSLFLFQELGWKKQRIAFKFSVSPRTYDLDLSQRAGELFGKGGERILKDYNTQTYWLSFNIKSFVPKSKIPSWLNIAIGYGGEGMFGGFENKAEDGSFDRRDIQRYRQWYLAPDLDFTAIPTNSKFVRTILFMANAIKLPSPALEYSRGKFSFRPLQF